MAAKLPAPAAPNRDSVTTIRDDGSRRFVHPADLRGRFATWRRVSALGLIAFYLSLPWIPINGYPAVFLDVGERRFHLFGATLAAQDMFLLFFLITGVGFALYFVTALLGRVWCGWACPQTVFLDHVYRRVERWIDGDAPARRALDAAPWTTGKTVRRVAKHVIYFVLSAGIAHLFLAYFVSLPQLWAMMRADPAEHWSAFLFVFIASGILYFNFAWFREQLCIVICPYGRLQSALIDDDSMVIGYDERRGEPRGKPGSRPDVGACVDCNRCVSVCPTGIDIRQGLQMECIACTACIDACDTVMDKLQRPRGLIRYDSLRGLGGKPTRWLRPRTYVYTALLLIGAIVFTTVLSRVQPAACSVTRMPGGAYVVDETAVRNQFLLRVVNKRNEPVAFRVAIQGAPAGVTLSGWEGDTELGPLGEEARPLILRAPRASYAGSFHFTVHLTDVRGSVAVERKVEFLGPDPRLLKTNDDDHADDHDAASSSKAQPKETHAPRHD